MKWWIEWFKIMAFKATSCNKQSIDVLHKVLFEKNVECGVDY